MTGTTHVCPICHRGGFFTDETVASHVDKEHPVAARSCRKIRYRTRADAVDALISTARKPRREHRVYACPSCGGYHLTSKPARTERTPA